MKRHKWWLLALSLALLAACVGVWKWSERPPFRFLEGASLSFVDIGTVSNGNESVSRVYTSKEALDQVLKKAERELGPNPWGHPRLVDTTGVFGPAQTRIWAREPEAERLRPVEGLVLQEVGKEKGAWNSPSPGIEPSFPPGTRTVIIVDLEPIPAIDRIRAWVFSLRYRGTRN